MNVVDLGVEMVEDIIDTELLCKYRNETNRCMIGETGSKTKREVKKRWGVQQLRRQQPQTTHIQNSFIANLSSLLSAHCRLIPCSLSTLPFLHKLCTHCFSFIANLVSCHDRDLLSSKTVRNCNRIALLRVNFARNEPCLEGTTARRCTAAKNTSTSVRMPPRIIAADKC